MTPLATRQIRLRGQIVAMLSYVADLLILSLYAALGTISWTVIGIYLLIAVVSAVFFSTVVMTGLSDRFKPDPSMTYPHMTTCGLLQLGLMIYVPQLTFIFLINMFIIFLFGVIQFSRRGIMIGWVLVALGSFVVLSGHDKLPVALNSRQEVLLLWLFFVMAVARFFFTSEYVSGLREAIRKRNRELHVMIEKIENMARHDELTQVFNRRHFMEILRAEEARALRTKRGFCVALFDLDKFKSINDRFGHLVGDAALKGFAQVVQKGLRDTDGFARYGGEEFVMLLQETTAPQALIPLERVRAATENYDWSGAHAQLRVTVSIGVAAWQPGDALEVLLERADQAMYAAKKGGRNRVTAAA